MTVLLKNLQFYCAELNEVKSWVEYKKANEVLLFIFSSGLLPKNGIFTPVFLYLTPLFCK
ncbi:hypothetical protein M23134_05144 [Microscilla marina ATCC 23134]|uniref:Uncharacterized protein n=1 Tax=Microscilla marina ATCC 23134 TaxID=313606 RepID=A1ZD99_MICM2|nr:hypothetical protein M23134_05144 [Microscilla marina ATCC 23134]